MPHTSAPEAATATRPWLPYVLIIAGFAIISLLFCYPRLQGMVLSQHDNLSWQGMAREAQAYHDSTGVNTLWSNSQFGGMPTYTFYVPESKNLLAPVYEAVTSLLPKPANFFILAMLCFFALSSALKINKWIGALGALAFAFSTYNPIIIGAGHETKMYAIAFMPLVLAGVVLLFQKRYLLGAAITGLAFALEIGTAHYQIVFYLGIMLAMAMIALFIGAIRAGDLKRGIIAGAFAVVAVLLGAATHMSVFLPTQEYAGETMRGGQSEVSFLHDNSKPKSGGLDKDYAFRWSNGIGETFCILVPYLYGGSSSESADKFPELHESLENMGQDVPKLPGYWGSQPFLSGPVYFGAIVCFLFVLGLMVVRSPHKWWILAASIIGIVMSWGNNLPGLNYWLFDHIPYLNKFRTPSMVMAIPAFLFPLLGAWALHDVVRLSMPREELARKIWIAAAITGGLALILGVAGSAFFDFRNADVDKQLGDFASTMQSDRAHLARMSGLKSAFFIAAAAALLWLYVKEKLGWKPAVAGVAVLVAIDLISVAANYLNQENYVPADEYEAYFTPRQVDRQILQDPDPYYRVFDLSRYNEVTGGGRDVFNDSWSAYFHKCVGGYHPAKLEVYQDLIDVHLSNQGITAPVVDMLNTKYLIIPAGQRGEGQAFPNPGACGNAWFVDEARIVPNADSEILALSGPRLGDTAIATGGFQPLKTAVLRKDFAPALNDYAFGKDSAAAIRLTKYGLNELRYVSNNSQPGLAVFSEIWYPHGWTLTIDGKPAELMRANFLLRAAKIPAGRHELVMTFHPKSFETGDTLALIGSLGLILLIVGAVFAVVRRRRNTADAVA